MVQPLEQLLRQVPRPDPSLFADLSDVPAPPAGPAQAQLATEWLAAAALHLQLAAQGVHGLDAAGLGLEALAAEAAFGPSTAPPGPAGSVIIEELGAAQQPSTTRVPVDVVLLAALYAPDTTIQRPWAVEPVAAAALQLLAALAAKLSELPRLGQEHEGGQQQQAGASLLQEIATARTGFAPHQQRWQEQGQGQVQQLLVLVLPAAVQQLRPVLAAKVEHSRHQTARLEPYTGPGNFERCLAAGQLSWLVRQLSGHRLHAATSALLQPLLAAIEDPCPAVQACGLWALQHIAAEGDTANLRPHTLLLLEATRRALSGCSEASWPAVAAAAIAVVVRLEGGNPYSRPYHDTMAVLLDEGERCAHVPDRAAAWLAAAPALFPRLGLQLAAHFSRLMPLLLGWCLAPQQSVRAAALGAVLEAIRLTWPRMAPHAPVIWAVLRRVHSEALELASSKPPLAPAGAGAGLAARVDEARAVADCAEDCGMALWCAGGTDFQVQLMTGRDAGQDRLLQTVMERLEAGMQQEQEQLRQEEELGQGEAAMEG